jgi:hypothetical protein
MLPPTLYEFFDTHSHRHPREANTRAAQDIENERVQQVKYGSTLNEQLIENRSQTFEAQQDLLITELRDRSLQLSRRHRAGVNICPRVSMLTTESVCISINAC